MIQGFWTLLKWWLKILDYSECTSWWFCQPNSWIDYDGLRLTMSDFILNFTSPCCVLFIVEFCELPHKMGPPRYVKVGLLPVTSSLYLPFLATYKATERYLGGPILHVCLGICGPTWPIRKRSHVFRSAGIGHAWDHGNGLSSPTLLIFQVRASL